MMPKLTAEMETVRKYIEGDATDKVDPTDLAAIAKELDRLGVMYAWHEEGTQFRGHGEFHQTGVIDEGSELFRPDIENSGYETIRIPPDVFGPEVEALALRIIRSVQRLEPAANPMMAAVYRVLARMADQGIQTNVSTVVLGLLLAQAKVYQVRIDTHPRDLAKEVGVRYSTLLTVRKLAANELATVPAFSGNLS